MLILVENLQLRLEQGEKGVLLLRLGKKLIVDIELQDIPHLQADIPLGPFAVAFDPLEADILLREGSGEEGQVLCQPAVQPLPGIVFSDGKLSHARSSRLCLSIITKRAAP